MRIGSIGRVRRAVLAAVLAAVAAALVLGLPGTAWGQLASPGLGEGGGTLPPAGEDGGETSPGGDIGGGTLPPAGEDEVADEGLIAFCEGFPYCGSVTVDFSVVGSSEEEGFPLTGSYTFVYGGAFGGVSAQQVIADAFEEARLD